MLTIVGIKTPFVYYTDQNVFYAYYETHSQMLQSYFHGNSPFSFRSEYRFPNRSRRFGRCGQPAVYRSDRRRYSQRYLFG